LSRKSSSWWPSRRVIGRDDAQPSKFAVALQPLRRDDERGTIGWLHAGSSASAWRSRSAGTSKPRFHPLCLARWPAPLSHEHRHFADEIARAGGAEDLLLPVAQLEDFEFAGRVTNSPRSPLARLEYHSPRRHDASGAERLQHGKLSVVEFREGDVLCITIKIARLCRVGS